MYLAASDMKDMAGSSVGTINEAANPNGVDLFQKLPTEVLADILSYMPTHDLYSLQRVSKTWQQAIICTQKLWHVLDFTQTIQAVPISTVRSALRCAGGNVRQVLISNIVHKDATACMNLLFRRGDATDGVLETAAINKLWSFRADFCASFFTDWRHFGDRELNGFQNLEELRVPLRIHRMLLTCLQWDCFQG
jgi:hypothetical protein